jgi:gas vesicle protein
MEARGTQIAFHLMGGENAVMSARPAKAYIGMALLGGLVGAALGLLAAPAPGTDTRRRMTGRISVEDQESLLRRAEMAAELLGDDLDLPASA